MVLVLSSLLLGTITLTEPSSQSRTETDIAIQENIDSNPWKVQREKHPQTTYKVFSSGQESNADNFFEKIDFNKTRISGKIESIEIQEDSSYFKILVQESENKKLFGQTISAKGKFYDSSEKRYQTSGDSEGWEKGDLITGDLSRNQKSEGIILETFSKESIWQQVPRKRERVYLKEKWRFKSGKRNEGKLGKWFESSYDVSTWRQVFVPSCWNTYDGSLEHYQGAGYYRKSFFVPENWSEKQISLHFLGVNQRAKVWINGEYVGSHRGGFTGFSFEIKDFVEVGKLNDLAVKVDSTREYFAVPAKNYIWKNWGGIYREVYLEASNNLSISNSFVDSRLNLENNNSIENVEIWIKNQREKKANIDLKISVFHDENLIFKGVKENILSIKPSSKGTTSVEFKIEDPLLWSPNHPQLYTMKISLMDNSGKIVDGKDVTFGIRKLEVENNKLYLNGEAITLKGVSRHEEYPGVGRAVKEANIRKDFEMMKKANINFVRLGHYPNHPMTLKLADEYGLLVYEEIPAYRFNTGQLSNPRVVKSAENQLKEMIKRDYNHPSVIIWGLGNEIASDTEVGENFLQMLYSIAENLDPKRFKTYTTDKPHVDKCLKIPDIISLNEYYGWFLFSKTSKLRTVLENLHKRFPEKPILISEFGASGVRGRHGNTRFTEEIQAEYLADHLDIIQEKNYTVGSTVWIFANYRDPTKVTNPTGFMNQKGVVDYYRIPKLGFHSLKEIYAGEKPEIPKIKDPIRLTTLDLGVILLFAITLGFFFSGVYRRKKSRGLLDTHLFRVFVKPRIFFGEMKQSKPKTRSTITFFLFTILASSASFCVIMKTFTIHHFPIFITRSYWFNYSLRLVLTNPFATFFPFLALFLALTTVHYLLSNKLGKTNNFEESLTLTTWSASPYLLFLPLAIALLFTNSLTLIIVTILLSMIWAITLLAIGTQKNNKTSTIKTVTITIIPYLTLILIIILFLAYTFWPFLKVEALFA